MLLSKAHKRFQLYNAIFLTIMGIVFIFPLVFVIKTSLDISPMSYDLSLWPKQPSVLFYFKIVHDAMIYRPFLNSIYITVVGTSVSTIVSCMGAYALSKRDLPAMSKIVYFLVVIPMFISGGIVPTYILLKSLGLFDSLTVLWLPSVVNAMNIIIMRNYFWTIPKSLQEAARIDGASEFRVFLQIILPLSKSVIAATSLFTGVAFWNSFMPAILYNTSANKKTFPVVIREIMFKSSSTFTGSTTETQQLLAELGLTGVNVMYINPDATAAAVTIVSFLPILIVYPMLQKHFAAGMLKGSIKG